MSSSHYAADPARLQAAIREIKALRTHAQALLERFRSGLSSYANWMGQDDDYARQARPPYQRSTQGTITTLEEIIAALKGIEEGLLTQLGGITQQQSTVLDDIADALKRTEKAVLDGENGGRH